MAEEAKCAVCGSIVEDGGAGSSEICDVCHWQEDRVQEQNPDYEGGANDLSLNQARALYQRTGKRIR
jgi:hypothetical protein